jgi:hypothetical protein
MPKPRLSDHLAKRRRFDRTFLRYFFTTECADPPFAACAATWSKA